MKMNNETKVGLMVSVLIVSLAVLTVKTGKFNLSNDGYVVKVHFQNVDGVNLNSPVMFNGLEVGIVEDVAISEGEKDTKIELTLWVNESARLRKGAKAYIKNLGFMGEKYVGLTSGDIGEAYLLPGSVIIGENPPNFEKLISDGQEIATRLNSIARNIDERLTVNKETVDETLVNLNSAMKDLASIVKNANERLGANERKIDDTVANLHDLSVNLEELSYDLKLNPWKIMYRGKENKRTVERE
jgi:phospholipid/cholesterol/gamma-HCH transport system substrate-binding protein